MNHDPIPAEYFGDSGRLSGYLQKLVGSLKLDGRHQFKSILSSNEKSYSKYQLIRCKQQSTGNW